MPKLGVKETIKVISADGETKETTLLTIGKEKKSSIPEATAEELPKAIVVEAAAPAEPDQPAESPLI